MSCANPEATTYYAETHPVQEEWNLDQLKILREIQRAVPMLGPVLTPISSLTQGLATTENVHLEAPTSSVTTTTRSSSGKQQAKTVVLKDINIATTSTGTGTKDDAKDSIHDNNDMVETDSTPPRPKRKCTIRKKSEDEADTVGDTGDSPKKKQVRTRASTATGNGKVIRGKEGDDTQTEVDQSGEITEPEPIRKNQSRAAASTSKAKQKATTKNTEDDMKIVAEASPAVNRKSAPTRMGATRGRPKGATKEITKAKAKAKAETKDGKDKKAKPSAADGEDHKPVKTQKKQDKVTTPKAKGQGNKPNKTTDGDMGAETEGHSQVTEKPTRFQSFAGTGACKGKGVIRKGPNKGDAEAYATDEEEPVLEPVERKRRTTAKARGKAKARDENSDEDKDTSIPILVPMNPSDPCSLFPTELWHAVLDHLPLSTIACTSSVSNAWLTGARTYRGWAIAATNGKMGVPKIKYRTFMALVCSKSFFVCDQCFGYSAGKVADSDIPLPVNVDGNPADTWHLCMACRRKYYRDHPEALLSPCNPNDEANYMPDERITKTRAMALYQLNQFDLATLHCTVHRNPHYRTAAPMRLYDMADVQRMALAMHAGWVGVIAARSSVLKKKRRAYKARNESNKIRTMPKREKKPKVPKAPAAPIPNQHGGDSDDMGRSGNDEYFDDNYGEGSSCRFRYF
ncbi:hypothetical protein BGZ92_003815 [Podila epicladia]|nr:hypothetical protein BGZ92_003815 [Podila epicladia]